VAADSRTVQAALVGFAAAVALTLLGMMFYYVLDDRIQVAGDFKQVTDVPFIGYCEALGRLGADYEGNLAYLREKNGKISVLSIKRGEEITKECWEDLCAADGVVVAVSYGQVHAVYLSYVIEQLRVRECRLVGVAVCGADAKFLGRYYGRSVCG